ncbi:hypothetical protein PM082_014843 [Marasmius tenuissimus]|nr:hypothetical protein PM082_014843 [Marasmius tenuissimus]
MMTLMPSSPTPTPILALENQEGTFQPRGGTSLEEVWWKEAQRSTKVRKERLHVHRKYGRMYSRLVGDGANRLNQAANGLAKRVWNLVADTTIGGATNWVTSDPIHKKGNIGGMNASATSRIDEDNDKTASASMRENAWWLDAITQLGR